MTYVPSTWPGARLPHVWLDDGTALHDRLRDDRFTLLRLGGTRASVAELGRAFVARRAPLQIMDVEDERPREIYGVDLLLVRPDLHVAWRGNALPADVDHLAALVTGHSALPTAPTRGGHA
jgi:hypothetical protein